MNNSSPAEMHLAAALARIGIKLAPDQLRDIAPGVPILQSLIKRVNTPLLFDGEPAVIFNPDKQR
jgi:hypothetical protein